MRVQHAAPVAASPIRHPSSLSFDQTSRRGCRTAHLPTHPSPPQCCRPLLQFQGSHGALGDRARKLASEGILVIRFEMPFNVWCLGCNHLIAKVGGSSACCEQAGRSRMSPPPPTHSG